MLRCEYIQIMSLRASTYTHHFAPIIFSRNFSSERDILSWQSLCQWFIIGRPAQPIYNRTYQLRNETMKEKTSECNENKRCWTCHFQICFCFGFDTSTNSLVKRLGSSWYLESFSHTSAKKKNGTAHLASLEKYLTAKLCEAIGGNCIPSSFCLTICQIGGSGGPPGVHVCNMYVSYIIYIYTHIVFIIIIINIINIINIISIIISWPDFFKNNPPVSSFGRSFPMFWRVQFPLASTHMHWICIYIYTHTRLHTYNTVDGWNPAPAEVGSLSHYLQGFMVLYIQTVVGLGISEPSTICLNKKRAT